MCKAAEWQYYESACPDNMYMHALAVLIEVYVVTKFSLCRMNTQHILLFLYLKCPLPNSNLGNDHVRYSIC